MRPTPQPPDIKVAGSLEAVALSGVPQWEFTPFATSLAEDWLEMQDELRRALARFYSATGSHCGAASASGVSTSAAINFSRSTGFSNRVVAPQARAASLNHVNAAPPTITLNINLFMGFIFLALSLLGLGNLFPPPGISFGTCLNNQVSARVRLKLCGARGAARQVAGAPVEHFDVVFARVNLLGANFAAPDKARVVCWSSLVVLLFHIKFSCPPGCSLTWTACFPAASVLSDKSSDTRLHS